MDTGKVARESNRHTRVVKGRLRDGVSANAELELNHVTDWGLKLPWREGQLVAVGGGDFDDVDLDVRGGGGGCKDSTDKVGSELHVCVWVYGRFIC